MPPEVYTAIAVALLWTYQIRRARRKVRETRRAIEQEFRKREEDQ